MQIKLAISEMTSAPRKSTIAKENYERLREEKSIIPN